MSLFVSFPFFLGRKFAGANVVTVNPMLIEENDKDDIITEASNTMKKGHADDERKEVVDDGV